MHRWHQDFGLDAPTIYCRELFRIFESATAAIASTLTSSAKASQPLILPFQGRAFVSECKRWRESTESRANDAALALGVTRRAIDSAAGLLLSKSMLTSSSLKETNSHATEAHRWLNSIRLQSNEQQLIEPYRESILPLASTDLRSQFGILSLQQVEQFLIEFDPSILESFATLISDILFVEPVGELGNTMFSFSDDSAPNVLYVAPFAGNSPLGPDDLADSLLHEFFHQTLYHMEREGKMLHDHVYPRFPAPWRSDLRPSGGFLHGTFVFAGLAKYWYALT